MKLLECLVCGGEVDIIGNEYQVHKKVKCKKCGFTNTKKEAKKPDVIIIKKR